MRKEGRKEGGRKEGRVWAIQSAIRLLCGELVNPLTFVFFPFFHSTTLLHHLFFNFLSISFLLTVFLNLSNLKSFFNLINSLRDLAWCIYNKTSKHIYVYIRYMRLLIKLKKIVRLLKLRKIGKRIEMHILIKINY